LATGAAPAAPVAIAVFRDDPAFAGSPGKSLLNHGLASKTIGGWQVSGILTMNVISPRSLSMN
jgi:hypothetical protein